MLTVTDVSLQFAGDLLYKHVDLSFQPNHCYGIIGANGAGKSTLLRIISGELQPTTGTISMQKTDRMSVLEQNHFKYDAYSVMDTVIMWHLRRRKLIHRRWSCHELMMPTRNGQSDSRYRHNLQPVTSS